MAAWDNDPIITPAAQVAPSAAIAPPVMGAAPAVPAANPWDNDPIVQAAPKPVAPAVSAPAPVVAQPAPVAAQQLSPIPSPLSSPPAAAPVQDAAPATPEPGFLDKVGNFFTGADRETRATNELPELQNSGLLAGLGMSPAKAAALSATLATTLDPEEMSRILKASSPDIGVEQDEKGNFIVANNKTGAQAVVNKPGVSALDALQLAATAEIGRAHV